MHTTTDSSLAREATRSNRASPTPLTLGQSHGYRFEGDTAILNAELASEPAADLDASWALQLWACHEPYDGGDLRGIKVAEAELAHASARRGGILEAVACAALPPAQREYTMVMVLASGSHGTYDQVRDFANYPRPQGFRGPLLEGEVSQRRDGRTLRVEIERVRNTRMVENVSGTLVLELWSLSSSYEGGAFAGSRLAQLELGRLAGASCLDGISLTAEVSALRDDAHVTLMLREWTDAFGYVTRDFHNLADTASSQTEQESRIARDSLVECADTTALTAPALTAPALTAPALTAPAPRAGELSSGPVKISLQHASPEQLALVPGLNRKLALAIVRARPFDSLDKLTRVRGIGDSMVRKLKPYLTV